MDDFLISSIYEYLDRVVSFEESQYQSLCSRMDLKKSDSVDIIDLIELQQRYEVLCQVQHDLVAIIKWARSVSESN